MRINVMLLAATMALLPLSSIGCDKKEEVKTVDWYMAPENKAAYEAKLAECRNNPGELDDDPNCKNAFSAQHQLFAEQPPIEFKFKP